MLEIFIVIQTIVVIGIFIIFLLLFFGIKKESEILKEKITKFEADIKPILTETKSLLANLNKISSSIKDITDDARQISHKIKESAIAIESVVSNFKYSVDKTKTKVSVLKLGLQTGVSTFLGYYLKKMQKKEEL